MTVHWNDAQLRADLEALYDSLRKGWCQYGANGGVETRYGEATGCLSQQMAEIVGQSNHLTKDAQDRYIAMLNALGFRQGGLFTWNDHEERTWDDVKELVKDTIGKL